MEIEVTASTADKQARAPALPAKCAHCEVLQQAPLVCTDCHALLAHVQGADYFELFGLPRAHAIDPAELNRRYLAISRNIHPDRFAREGSEMQSFALRASAAVNRAYETLSNPMRRADYLLESFGGKSASQDKRVPPEFLSETMLLREEIEEAKADGNAAALQSLNTRLVAAKEETERRILELCEQIADGGDEVKDELRMTLNTLKYHANLLAQFEQQETE